MEGGCAHINSITTIKHAKRRACEECIKIGARWVHLRTCQACGATLCCDSSPNRHASKHAGAAGPAAVASSEPGQRWLCCYPNDAFAENCERNMGMNKDEALVACAGGPTA